MNRELDKFLNVHVPGRGYHSFNGEVDTYSEKDLSFECVCGVVHRVKDSTAIIEFPLENKAVYLCPESPERFNLVKAQGLFSIKGLKTIASFTATAEEAAQVMGTLESRKKTS